MGKLMVKIEAFWLHWHLCNNPLFCQLEMLQRLDSPRVFQSLVTSRWSLLSSFNHSKNDSTLFGISGRRMELNWHEKKHLNTDSRKMEKNSISLLMSQPRRTVDTTLWRPMVGYQSLSWLCKVGTGNVPEPEKLKNENRLKATFSRYCTAVA